MNIENSGHWKAWQLDSEKGTNYWRIRTNDDNFSLDTLHGYCGTEVACLITATPDMYEALTMVKMAFELAKKTMPVNMRVAVEQFVLPAIQKAERR